MALAVIGCSLCWLIACAPLPPPGNVVSTEHLIPGKGPDQDKTVIYRDTWGVPHIYAPTANAGLYAQGYAQAQDRPTQLLLNLLVAKGELSSVAGESTVQTDILSHMFDHHGIGQRQFDRLNEYDAAPILAFTAGVNAFYRDHPEDRPIWWRDREVTPAMVMAFGRLFLYSWAVDDALGDLARAGIAPDFSTTARGSNQWAVAPERSASGKALLLIDPHLSWSGPSRFWEMRIHAGALHGSGVGLPGFPYIGLGHNENLAWAMTTGGPDTGDVFELTLNPKNALQYRFDGAWRDLLKRRIRLQVQGAAGIERELLFDHRGPVVAYQPAENKAYVAAIAYDENAEHLKAWQALNFAKSYQGVQRAAATQALFPQNVMAADTAGNIYYQRVGRVPRRSASYDYSLPVDGATTAADWQGMHPSAEHLQVLNPPQGYMQNCNVPPDAMMVNSPFRDVSQPEYLVSSKAYGEQRVGWSKQRGARALELLAANASVSVDDALAYAVDVTPFGVQRWLDALRRAVGSPTPRERALLDWDGQIRRDSAGALKYVYWRSVLAEHELMPDISAQIDDFYAQAAGREMRAVVLSGEQLNVLRATYSEALDRMARELGTTNAVYGDVYRVGRGTASWPVGGGGDEGDLLGRTTLRNIRFAAPNERLLRMGEQGQTATQLVHLTTPIQSWIYSPIGQSDREDSPHYTDQAQGPFSRRSLRPSWWLPEDLKHHIASRLVLEPDF